MILYFADRQLNILGQASTRLQKGVKFESDTKIESIETGVATFECYVLFNSDKRARVEAWAEVGNYILSKSDGENKLYCIIDSEIDTKKGRAYVYAEDDGLDLLNEIVEPYAADRYYPISHYVGMYATNAGWEIGINEVEGLTRQLSFDNEQTASARLLNIAESFNNCELSFSFDIKGLKVAKKYINIYEKRGNDTGIQLRLNKEIDNIIITKSIANIATALRCTGGTPEDVEKPITLEGYTYDDGDFYVEGAVLKSRKALEKWRRYLWKADTEQLGGHIVKPFPFDTTSQEVLCENAIAKLKKICDMEVNYEADITKFPEKVRIGDRVNIIDDKGSLYLSSRVLTLETSVADNVKCAVLGEHLIKKSGISAKVEELANQFSELAESRVFYTWVAYADDENGTGISLNPAGKDYLGIAANKLKKAVDISDPSIFEWSKIKGEKGEQGEPGTPGVSGADGISVVRIVDLYYLSSSSTTSQAGDNFELWSTTLPEWQSGHYIWERKAVTWSDGSTTYTEPILSSTLNHANEAAEFAQQQANTAAQSANQAQQSAANADTAAQEAANKASQAESLAQTASGTAAQAKSEAEAAQSAADKANADIVTINNDIANVRKEVTEGLETVTNTISADYAKKTELTDIQGNLQTQISKNAAGIETTAKSVEDVKIDASNAIANANEAKETATTAQNTANTAKAEAEAAQAAADSASQAAQTARDEATAAQTAAEKAETAAENAKAVANAADKDLQTAKASLEAVTGRVDATEEDIAAAQQAVNAAQAAADAAKADSVAAQSAAAQAKSTADTAKANADAAQAAAGQAQTDANNAKNAADKAQSDADKALADLATMGNRVTEAETKIQQNVDAIALTATKEEVTEAVEGLASEDVVKEMQASLTLTAEGITSRVEDVETKSGNNEKSISAANSQIEQLANSIKSLVVGKNGESLMTQTEDGWSFDFATIYEEIQNSTKRLAEYDDRIQLGQYVNEDGETEPSIEFSETSSDFKVVITNKRILFFEGSSIPTYIFDNALVTENIEVKEELRQGGWVWKVRANGNLGLSWKGAVS